MAFVTPLNLVRLSHFLESFLEPNSLLSFKVKGAGNLSLANLFIRGLDKFKNRFRSGKALILFCHDLLLLSLEERFSWLQ